MKLCTERLHAFVISIVVYAPYRNIIVNLGFIIIEQDKWGCLLGPMTRCTYLIEQLRGIIKQKHIIYIFVILIISVVQQTVEPYKHCLLQYPIPVVRCNLSVYCQTYLPTFNARTSSNLTEEVLGYIVAAQTRERVIA